MRQIEGLLGKSIKRNGLEMFSLSQNEQKENLLSFRHGEKMCTIVSVLVITKEIYEKCLTNHDKNVLSSIVR